LESLQNLDANELVKKADLALYEAKEKGRGSYCFYTESLHKQATTVRRLTELVELNAPEDMFQMAYQPYIELATGRIVGVEALLRCIHPECAAIPTIDIITMLERNGHISNISQWVMKVALDQLTEWHNTLYLPDDFTMSVNVSAALLPDTNFVQAVLDIVEQSEVSGSSLTIELTETTVMEDYTRCKDAMRQLNSIGIELAWPRYWYGSHRGRHRNRRAGRRVAKAWVQQRPGLLFCAPTITSRPGPGNTSSPARRITTAQKKVV